MCEGVGDFVEKRYVFVSSRFLQLFLDCICIILELMNQIILEFF